jgi:hypothetical protein
VASPRARRWRTCCGASSPRPPPRTAAAHLQPAGDDRGAGRGPCAGRHAGRERVAFLATLVDCHALAIKAGLRGMAAVPEFAAPRAPQLANARSCARRCGSGDFRSRTSAPEDAAASAHRLSARRALGSLAARPWVEFGCLGGPPARARLSWVSPGRGATCSPIPHRRDPRCRSLRKALAEQMRLAWRAC